MKKEREEGGEKGGGGRGLKITSLLFDVSIFLTLNYPSYLVIIIDDLRGMTKVDSEEI